MKKLLRTLTFILSGFIFFSCNQRLDYQRFQDYFSIVDGKLYYKDKLFTGETYGENNNGSYTYLNGVREGEYSVSVNISNDSLGFYYFDKSPRRGSQMMEYGFLSNGKKQGLITRYYPMGNYVEEKSIPIKHYEGYWESGVENGDFKYYWDSGTLNLSGTYKSGLIDGTLNVYYDTSIKIESVGSYSNKVEVTPTENLLFYTLNYDNGVLLKEYQEYYKNGKIKIRTSLNENGEVHGPYEEYYPDNNLRLITIMSNGLIDGEFVEYYPNGKIRSKGKTSNGKLVGSFENRNEDGSIRKIRSLDWSKDSFDYPLRTYWSFSIQSGSVEYSRKGMMYGMGVIFEPMKPIKTPTNNEIMSPLTFGEGVYHIEKFRYNGSQPSGMKWSEWKDFMERKYF